MSLNPESFEKAIKPLIPELRNYAYKRMHNWDDAHDLVQETLTKAFCYMGAFEEGTNFRAWLYRILINISIDQFHKTERAPKTVDFADLEFCLTGSPSKSQDFSLEVKQALDKVPEDFKKVLLMSDLEDWTYAEIAKRLDLPVGTVRSRLFRGRKIMKRELGDYVRENRIVSKETLNVLE
jgi:RNA polymerase sigma-70 factor (ECF subfamily)